MMVATDNTKKITNIWNLNIKVISNPENYFNYLYSFYSKLEVLPKPNFKNLFLKRFHRYTKIYPY